MSSLANAKSEHMIETRIEALSPNERIPDLQMIGPHYSSNCLIPIRPPPGFSKRLGDQTISHLEVTLTIDL